MTKVRKERRDCQRLCKRRKKSLNEKNQVIRSLRLQLKKTNVSNDDDKKLIDAVKANPVLKESLENSFKNKHARRYRATRLLATRQKISSTSSYKKFRAANVMCMPHPKTVCRWYQDVQLAPGFNREVLKRMSLKSREMTEQEKTVAVLIDGMAIKAMVDYHAKSDKFHGFPCDGEILNDNEQLSVATEAITIMVSSIHANFKQVRKFKKITRLSLHFFLFLGYRFFLV